MVAVEILRAGEAFEGRRFKHASASKVSTCPGSQVFMNILHPVWDKHREVFKTHMTRALFA